MDKIPFVKFSDNELWHFVPSLLMRNKTCVFRTSTCIHVSEVLKWKLILYIILANRLDHWTKNQNLKSWLHLHFSFKIRIYLWILIGLGLTSLLEKNVQKKYYLFYCARMKWTGLVKKRRRKSGKIWTLKKQEIWVPSNFKSGLELTIRASNVKIRLSFTVSNIFKLSNFA